MPRSVFVDHHGDVAVVSLSRPPVNALDREMVDEITTAVEEVARQASAIVLTGHRAFSAGIDTQAFQAATVKERGRLALAIDRMLVAVVGTDQPVVAAVTGHALGGGLVLALACDRRLAAEGDAQLGLPEVVAGVAFPTNAVHVVQASLHPALVGRLVLAGERLDPNEALGVGVVDEVVAPGDLLDTAVERARTLAALTGFGAVKAQFRAVLRTRLQEVLSVRLDPVVTAWARLPRSR
jgi:enoyl-CoA hydratase